MAIDGAVQEADRGKVREFERRFPAGFSRLSQSRNGADGKQRGQRQSLFQKASCQAAALERSSGEPGAHNESSKNESIIRNLILCFRYRLPAKYPVFEHALVHHTGASITGIPNTLPPQDLNGVLELGRVGVCARAGRRLELCSERSSAKRAFITFCDDGGQSHIGGVSGPGFYYVQ